MNRERSVEDLARDLDEADWEPQGFGRERSRAVPRRRRPGSARSET